MPVGHSALTTAALYKAVKMLNSGEYTRKEAAEACSVSEATLYRYIRKERAEAAAAERKAAKK